MARMIDLDTVSNHELVAELNDNQKYAVYLNVKYELVKSDIEARLEDTDDSLTPIQIVDAAYAYVYEGKHDSEEPYWSTIDSLIDMVRND